MTTVSVAMATYNGEKYILEQLESIVRQTHKPNQIVISDDCSTDRTVEIIMQYSKVSRVEIRLYKNSANVGHIRNFEKALELCVGDFIFISDQDDCWDSNKIESVLDAFQDNEGLHVIINDMEICDANLVSSGTTYFGNVAALNIADKYYIAGCATCITRKFRDFIVPFSDHDLVHDGVIHFIADKAGVRSILREPLQRYRRHSSNSSSPDSVKIDFCLFDKAIFFLKSVTTSAKGDLVLALNQYRLLSYKLTYQPILFNNLNSQVDIATLEAESAAMIESINLRLNILNIKLPIRIFYVLKAIFSGDYSAFSGWKSAVKDICN